MDTMRVGEGAKALRVGVKIEKREPSTAGSTQARSGEMGASARSRVRHGYASAVHEGGWSGVWLRT